MICRARLSSSILLKWSRKRTLSTHWAMIAWQICWWKGGCI